MQSLFYGHLCHLLQETEATRKVERARLGEREGERACYLPPRESLHGLQPADNRRERTRKICQRLNYGVGDHINDEESGTT